MKRICLLILVVFGILSASSQKLYLHRTDNMTLGAPVTSSDSILFSSDGSIATLLFAGKSQTLDVASLDSITFSDEMSVVSIDYSVSGVRVVNPFAFEGVEVLVNNGRVVVTSTADSEITYQLSGLSSDGQFKLYSDKKYTINLNGLSLASTDGPALNLQSKKRGNIVLVSGTTNSLSDATAYTPIGSEDMKGCIFSEGQLVFSGTGLLNVESAAKHAICSDDYVSITDGTIFATAANDAVHANDFFSMSGGSLTTNALGDGIDVDGYISVLGGAIHATVASDDTKGLKCDSTLWVSGGTIQIDLCGAQSKAFKTSQSMNVSGGDIVVTASGNVVVTNGEPSYCTAIKTINNFEMSSGSITVTHSGVAGKGISSDADVNITGGTFTMTSSGDGATYTNASNTTDTYCSTCLSSDGNMTILDGTLRLTATGLGGKDIKSDGTLTFGDATHSPTVVCAAEGAKIGSSSDNGPGGGRPGGRPGDMGSSSSSNTSTSPKAIKSMFDLMVNNGNFTITTKQDGGEGLESKATVTINGGVLDINTYDDGINASKAIVINGGKIYSYASNNDGIDSNGTITMNGGVTVSSGANFPEEGLDCDNNQFKVTGGVFVGMGGATSNPTSNVCTQPSVKYSAGSVSQNNLISVVDADGMPVFSITLPRSYTSMVMLFSSPRLTTGSSYSLYKGGSVSGGETFKILTTGGSFTGGTKVKTFTPSSMLTSM